MLEGYYQHKLKKKLLAEFPGCVVIKLNDFQGLPDLLVLFCNRWAMLEVKTSETASHEPNQDYYVDLFDQMSYASFIYPENEERVFDELHAAFESSR